MSSETFWSVQTYPDLLFSGSAEQPAAHSEASRAARPAGDSDDIGSGVTAFYNIDSDVPPAYKLAFYNIGSDVTATPNQHTTDGLATEICDMAHDKCVDAVGISVLFNPKDGRWQQLQAIMDQVVWKLNSSSEQRANSADSSAEPPAWKGQSDGHYVVVWNSQRLVLKAYSLVVNPHDIYHKDLRFQQAEWPSGPPLHVYHDCSVVRPVPVVVSVCPEWNAARTIPVVVL